MVSTSETRQRAELVAAGAALARLGLIRGREGNLSCRLDDGAILLTPRGTDKARLFAFDLVRCTASGPPPARASSEAMAHLATYRRNPSIGALVHAHPRAVLSLATRALLPDPNVLEEGRALVPRVELLPPLAPGSEDLATACASALALAPAVVVRRHGIFTAGDDVWQALERALVVEHLASIALSDARMGVEI